MSRLIKWLPIVEFDSKSSVNSIVSPLLGVDVINSSNVPT